MAVIVYSALFIPNDGAQLAVKTLNRRVSLEEVADLNPFDEFQNEPVPQNHLGPNQH